jgi:hypothetical protein
MTGWRRLLGHRTASFVVPSRRFAATKNPSRRVAIEGSAQAADLSATYALSKYEN